MYAARLTFISPAVCVAALSCAALLPWGSRRVVSPRRGVLQLAGGETPGV